jgi:FkbM family methyltransferase
MSLIKSVFRYLIPYQVYQKFRSWAYHTLELKHFRYAEYRKVLKNGGRSKLKIHFKGHPFILTDSQSFLFMHDEIFVKEIYKFQAEKAPFIIDCGANIGMSILYFKELFPKAEIIAFEPDPTIFKILNRNISSFNLNNVKTINSALGTLEGKVDFYSEGSDSGRIGQHIEKSNKISVSQVLLSKYLTKEVDLLKIDIEGAETDVIEEIRNELSFVKRIFIEYHSFINKESTLDRILGVLKANNFTIHINSPGVSSNQPFVKTPNKLGMDMQLNIYGFKTKKNAS